MITPIRQTATRLLLTCASALLVLFADTSAAAQVHWDASAGVGVAKRFLRDAKGGDAGFGPSAALRAHVALLPMIRFGAYATHDLSPQGGVPLRQLTTAGAEARWLPPILPHPFRGWVALGFGVARAYAPSYATTVAAPNATTSASLVRYDVAAGDGRFFQLPIVVGLGRPIGKPWTVQLELTCAYGFAFAGDLYTGRSASADGLPGTSFLPAGRDTFLTSLALGVGIDP